MKIFYLMMAWLCRRAAKIVAHIETSHVRCVWLRRISLAVLRWPMNWHLKHVFGPKPVRPEVRVIARRIITPDGRERWLRQATITTWPKRRGRIFHGDGWASRDLAFVLAIVIFMLLASQCGCSSVRSDIRLDRIEGAQR